MRGPIHAIILELVICIINILLSEPRFAETVDTDQYMLRIQKSIARIMATFHNVHKW